MCDELIHPGLVDDPRLSRRAFGAMAVSAAALAGAPALAANDPRVVETDVEVATPDGRCDAALFRPAAAGRHPAVLIWTDIMGLRPAFCDMGRRLAAAGYVVLVPNPFYRSHRAPVIDGPVDFSDPKQRSVLMGYRQAMGGAEGARRDAGAYLSFLDARPEVDRAKPAGVQGYCMGGGLAFETAAAAPERIAAVGSFHGGNGLATDAPDSPHLTVAHTRATYLVCQARNDDAQDPAMKDRLRNALAAAHRPATVEVYPADHGWCVPGGRVYDPVQAERAWGELTTLYRTRLG